MNRFSALTLALLCANGLSAEVQRPEIALGTERLATYNSYLTRVIRADGHVVAMWQSESTFFLTRFDDAGRPEPPVRMAVDPNMSLYDVAWNGHNYVVSAYVYDTSTFYILELNPDGSVAHEPVPISIAPEPPHLVANGQHVLAIFSRLVAFVESDGRLSPLPDVSPIHPQAAVADDDGFSVYGTVSIPSSSSAGTAKLFRIRLGNDGSTSTQNVAEIEGGAAVTAATSGTQELVAWTLWAFENDGIVHIGSAYMVIATKGDLIHAPVSIESQQIPIAGAPANVRPAAGWDGHEYAIAWIHQEPVVSELRLTRVASDGVSFGNAETIDTSTARSRGSNFSPVFASTPSHQFLFWYGQHDDTDPPTERVRFSPDFATISAASASVPSVARPRQEAPSMATDGEGVAIVWHEAAARSRIAAQVISRSGKASEPLLLTDETTYTSPPVIASGNGIYLAVWFEYAANVPTLSYRILVRRISADGALLDAQPIELQDGFYTQKASFDYPTVAWNGSHFVVAWTGGDNRGYAMRVSPAGQPLDFSPFFIDPDNSLGDIGIDLQRTGDEVSATFYALVATSTFEPMAVRTVRLQRSGAVSAPATLVSAGPRSTDIQSAVATAWNGHELLVGWLQLSTFRTPTCMVGRTFALGGAPTGEQKSLICDASPEIANHGAIRLQPDQNGWSILYGGSSTVSPSILNVNAQLDPIGDPLVISPSGSGIGAFLSLDNRIVVAYPRMEDAAAYAPRLFLQTIFLQGRVHAVRHP